MASSIAISPKLINTVNIAAKQTQNKKTSMKPKEDKHSLSSLMMLSSQLLSHGTFNSGLPSFVMKGLDLEQIWQQLELRNENKSSLTACTRNAARIQSSQNRKRKKRPKEKMNNYKQTKEKDSMQADEKESDISDKSDGEDDDILNSIKKRLEEKEGSENEQLSDFGDSEGEGDLDFDFQVENEIVKGLSDEDDEDGLGKNDHSNKKLSKKPHQRTTVVDDKFFKLADMEQFLDHEDKKEEKKIKKEKKGDEESDDEDDSDEDNDEIDMFADLESDGDEDAVSAKYTDFFDPPYKEQGEKSSKTKSKNDSNESIDDSKAENDASDDNSEEEEEEEENVNESKDEEQAEEEENVIESKDEDAEQEDEELDENSTGGQKKVSFPEDLLQSNEEESVSDTKEKPKSTHELLQEKLQKKAREMEELSLKDVSWELKGEALASKRPENSLLETVLDFQHSTRAAPVITDDTTKTLEDYIKQRIKDKTFDDVERKTKPKEDAFEFKKRIVLDQEKSKQSLGELYEQEFLKQQQQDDEEVKADPECENIEKQLNKLFHQLDALSNFRYTPMKPGTEVKIIVNTPAISMEEVAPVATADSELLAPEEVYDKKKGELKAADERSSTDKKRALRQKKKDKRERKKAKEAREKVVEKLNPGLGNKYSKDKAMKQLEQLSKSDKNVTMIKGERKKMGSSTAFFNQLQDEVDTNVKSKKVVKESKKRKIDPSLIML